MSCTENIVLSRRALLGGAAASLALWGYVPRAIAAGRDPRLLTIVLRGGLDGLSLAAPVGDSAYAGLRGRLALSASGPLPGLPLDGYFVLNAAMPFLHALYQKREALIVHAVATPYRGRSHFDGQDVLESGHPAQGRKDDGWMNRALTSMPRAGQADPKGLAMGAVVPLVMRGPAPVMSWTPRTYGNPLTESTIARLIELYSITDPKLAKAFADGVAIERMAESSGVSTAPPKGKGKAEPQQSRMFGDFIGTAEAAARFLSAPDGPRIGALSYNGWDTHANEGAVQGHLATHLAALDAAIKAFVEGMGPAWKDTVVLIVTEFGRTARINGTDGTDHGTATVALALGGAVAGGRIVADWPGLAHNRLFEGRDLTPTRDLRSLFKGVLIEHLGLGERALGERVFPESQNVAALKDVLQRA
jgi:uncharacterized protein (DUF1501 family)